VLALQRMMSEVEPVQTEAGPPAPIDFADMETVLRDWTWLRYTLVIAAVLAVIALLWFLFVQSDEEISQSEEQEPEQAEQRTQLAPGMPNFARLRDWLNLLRHYGVGRRLLNAISVENMYANLGRMARSRGYPRLPSQPPDAYLAQLRLAFPGQNAQLERMTAAYMRVHYGDLPVEEHEMRSLRDDYDQIKEAPEPDTYAT
jgi:hypothetical protein